MDVPVLLITGPVGVGKTSVLNEIVDLLQRAGRRFAVIDLDALSYCFPAPANDRYRTGVTFKNLAAVWRTFRAAGAERLVVSAVLESRDELARHRMAIPGAEITVVRLRAPIRTLQARARRREIGLGRTWSVKRAAELAKIMDDARVEDVLVDTAARPVNAIAREILDRVGWLQGRATGARQPLAR